MTASTWQGWKQLPGHKDHWKPIPDSGVLDYDGKSEAEDKCLWGEREFANFSLICDWRLNGTPRRSKGR